MGNYPFVARYRQAHCGDEDDDDDDDDAAADDDDDDDDPVLRRRRRRWENVSNDTVKSSTLSSWVITRMPLSTLTTTTTLKRNRNAAKSMQ